MGDFGKFRIGNCSVDVDEIYSNFGKELLREGPILVNVFTTQSVRTRTSFEAAAHKLGMNVITITEPRDQESLQDFGYYLSTVGDICVARVKDDEEFSKLTESACIPIINGGSGTEHPTQAICDVFNLYEYPARTRIGLFGPPTNRTLNSFKQLASRKFNVFHIKSERDFELCDVVYCVTFGNDKTLPMNLECKIMHPFPRGKVVPEYYDSKLNNLYFHQMKNLTPIRELILCAV